jgi:hypothetical protein
MKIIITVDTEADNQWKREQDINLENIKFLPRFQDLCQKHSFPPTYFVTHEVATDLESSNILKSFQDRKAAEIGAHLHPWTTPPYERKIEWERKHHRFPFELSRNELYSKMYSLTKAIEATFLRKPTSFRAGRWGWGENLEEALIELGYIVDSSITPHVSWKNTLGNPEGLGGPDYRGESVLPRKVVKPQGGLVEVPMSILPTGLLRKEGNYLQRLFAKLPESRMQKILDRVAFRYRWLRIFPKTNLKDLTDIYRSAVYNNLPVLVFMIHSSELMPGGSPYAEDEETVEYTYVLLEDFFSFLNKEGVEGQTLTKFAESVHLNQKP